MFFAKAVDLRVNLSGHATRLLQTFFMCPIKLGWIWKRTREAASANAKAASSLQASRNAGSVSGQYLANTVLFATVLFFASASGKFEQRRVRVVAFAFAVAVFLFAVVRTAMLPQ